MEDFNDPAADERRDEMLLKREMEAWRNQVRPEDLRAPAVLLPDSEPYWVWSR